VSEDGPAILIDATGNDTDGNSDALTVTVVDLTGTLGTVADNGDGTFGYDPNGAFEALAAGETATDTFSYTVDDGQGGTDTATVTVTINGQNDAPVAVAVAAAANEDGPAVVIAAAYTDVDTSDTHTFSVDLTGTLGTVTDNGDGTFGYDPDGQFEALAAGETAVDTFDYTVDDGQGGTDTATVSMTIAGVNDAPVFTASGPFQVPENTTAVGSVTASDVDGAALTFSIEGGADAGLFQIDGATGALSFLAAPDFETPGDAGGANVYDVTVGATDEFLFLTTAGVQVEVLDDTGETSINVIPGTPQRDILVGTAASDRFEFNGGAGDVGVGNGGDDVFDFIVNVGNGSRDSTRITDWSDGDTIVGFDLDDIVLASVRESAGAVRFAYGPDNDVLTITGELPTDLSLLFPVDVA